VQKGLSETCGSLEVRWGCGTRAGLCEGWQRTHGRLQRGQQEEVLGFGWREVSSSMGASHLQFTAQE